MDNDSHFEDIVKKSIKHIDDIIEESIKRFIEICKNKTSRSTNLTLPKKRNNNKLRMSEQEFKQVFLEVLNSKINEAKNSGGCCDEIKNWRYSVETPTHKRYAFSTPKDINNSIEVPCTVNDDNQLGNNRNIGCSAQIDVSIYSSTPDISDNKDVLLSHLEFKHGQARCEQIEKDLLKLSAEPECKTNYFLHIFDNINKDSLQSLYKKYKCEKKAEDNKGYKTLANYIKSEPRNVIIVYIIAINNSIKASPGYYKFKWDNAFHGSDSDWMKVEVVTK